MQKHRQMLLMPNILTTGDDKNMSSKRLGRQTVSMLLPPSVAAGACVVGKKEGQGPLRRWFDYISDDSYFGEKSWEKGESAMLKQCFQLACDKAKTPPSELDYIFTGDLLNQCAGSSFAMKDSGVPFFGLYGACSTMAEALSLAAMMIDGGFAKNVICATSSHFCGAEKQFRYPVEYGSARTPTSQWTVTGSGAAVISNEGEGPKITHITTGKVVDLGVTDAINMGAAMAPAAAEVMYAHFSETK